MDKVNQNYKKILKNTFNIGVYFFALVGFLLTAGYFGVKFGLTNTRGIIDEQRKGFFEVENQATPINIVWNKSEEWATLREALKKDSSVINQVSGETGVPARQIVAVIVVEQLRLFHSDRELFKKVFAPLKILGTQSQFSWGVSGIKPDTAKTIEVNLKNEDSPYYLGKSFENRLNFKTENIDEERFARMTDYKDRYFSYLYTALLMKQVETQWQKAGFPIEKNVGVIATLFNIGFERSVPKPDPKVGGAEIKINGKSYSFGGLAEEFYYSDELTDIFPKK